MRKGQHPIFREIPQTAHVRVPAVFGRSDVWAQAIPDTVREKREPRAPERGGNRAREVNA